MAHLMSDNEKLFTVVQHIHQSAVNSNGAFGHGKSIQRKRQVGFDVELMAIVCQVVANRALQSICIGIVSRRHGGFPV
jgi:hypothetical protein